MKIFNDGAKVKNCVFFIIIHEGGVVVSCMAYQLLIYNIIQYIYSLILKNCIKVLKNFLVLLLFCCSRTLKLNYSNQLSKIIHGT